MARKVRRKKMETMLVRMERDFKVPGTNEILLEGTVGSVVDGKIVFYAAQVINLPNGELPVYSFNLFNKAMYSPVDPPEPHIREAGWM